MQIKTTTLPYLTLGILVSLTLSLLIISSTMPTVTKAQESSVMNFSVGNAAPTMGEVTCDHETISEATNYIAWCYATVTDTNGYQDVVGCNGTFFKTSSGQAGAANNNIRYINDTCLLFGGTGNTVTCNCSFGMKYYADGNVEWTGNLTARDSSASVYSAGTKTVTQLLAMDLTTSRVQWGVMAVGAATTFNANNYTTVNNTGNVNLSIQIKAATAQMTCAPSPANVDCGQIKAWTQDANQLWSAGGQALTTGQETLAYGDSWADNRQHTPNEIENRTVYWAINVPSGVNGTCTITVNQYAAAGLSGT